MGQNNNEKQFGALAGYYDILNYNADYSKVADYIEGVFALYKRAPALVLDLACGTGNLAIELDRRGCDMTGLDLSAEMLAAASAKRPDGKILWLNQDMRSFELYGTVDAVVCCFDSLNYILDGADIKKCFSLVHNYLNYGGLFIFDVNSKYKFERVYAKNNFVLENKNVYCSWQNYYDEKTETCNFYLTLFVKQPDGLYKRYTETQKEKYHSEEFLKSALAESGFGDIKTFRNFKLEQASGNCERLCFAAAKI